MRIITSSLVSFGLPSLGSSSSTRSALPSWARLTFAVVLLGTTVACPQCTPPLEDAGPAADGGNEDGGTANDAGTDAGEEDAGVPDAGGDAGADAGSDAGFSDAGADAGEEDAGSDGGIIGADAGPQDGGIQDGGPQEEVGFYIDAIGWGGRPVFEGSVRIGNREEPIILGQAVFIDLPVGPVRGIVHAVGFAPANVFGTVLDGESTIAQALLLPVGVSIDFAADQAVDLFFDNIGVSISANSFVDEQGAMVTGTITAHLTTFDPLDDQPAAPGPFSGMGLDGEMDSIESFGMADFSFEANGNPVQLGAGQTATIAVGVPPGFGINRNETIPAWYYDLDQGHWVEEGFGFVTGFGDRLVWRNTVEHFSYWNADRKVSEDNCVVVELPFSLGRAFPVYSEGVDYSGVAIADTDDSNTACVEFKRGGQATIHAGSGSHGFTYSQNVVGNGDPADCTGGGVGCTTIIVQIPELSCVRGKVTQSGLGTQDAQVIVGYGRNLGVAITDVNGDFCSQVPTGVRVTLSAGIIDGSGSALFADDDVLAGGSIASCGTPELCSDVGTMELSVPPQYCLDGRATQNAGANALTDPLPMGTPLFAFLDNGSFTGIDCDAHASSWGIAVGRGTIGADGSYCLNLPLAESSRDLIFVADSCNRSPCDTENATPICTKNVPFSLTPGAETGFAGGICGAAIGCVENDIHFAVQ